MPLPFSRLILASHNTGKLRELQAMLADLPLAIESAGSLGLPEPEETGSTFIENALLKAHAAASATGAWALADDSGLVVPALDGAPGIYSARWAGPNKDFAMASQRIVDELTAKGETPEGTAAYFICVIALASADGEEHVFEGKAHGTLTFPARGDAGFGYDPIFVPNGHTQTFAQMPSAQKQAMSHRAAAFAQFSAWVKQQADAA